MICCISSCINSIEMDFIYFTNSACIVFEHDGHVAAMFFIACFSVKLVIHKIFVIIDSIIGSVWFALNKLIDIAGKRNNGAFGCWIVWLYSKMQTSNRQLFFEMVRHFVKTDLGNKRYFYSFDVRETGI